MNLGYKIGKVCFRALLRVYFRSRVVDAHHIPRSGPVILVANHASYLDPPLLGIEVDREIRFLARESLFRYPLIREILLTWRAVPVDREGGGLGGLRKILEALRAGGCVLVFPEGTRTHDGRLQEARSGIGMLILRSEAVVVPARVFGTYEAYGRYDWLPKPLPIMAKYGPPLNFSAERAEAKSCSKARLKELYQEVTDRVMAAIGVIEPYRLRTEFP